MTSSFDKVISGTSSTEARTLKILCAGRVCLDIIQTCVQYPSEDSTQRKKKSKEKKERIEIDKRETAKTDRSNERRKEWRWSMEIEKAQSNSRIPQGEITERRYRKGRNRYREQRGREENSRI
ncbi:uncharacterized protein LOC143894764 isoform X3 [Temnothorax americanus]|uniref:uncharacterized protein LOC143894764 isoform X3 n=1 Tax=Temnothorax americanus TaxID=1964332 RepID=UPI00406989D0